jgi:hypothetical protein
MIQGSLDKGCDALKGSNVIIMTRLAVISPFIGRELLAGNCGGQNAVNWFMLLGILMIKNFL